jgi:hypothetical protein
MYSLVLLLLLSAQVICDFTERFPGAFEVFDDVLGEDVGIGEVIGFFQTLLSEPKEVETGFVAVLTTIAKHV